MPTLYLGDHHDVPFAIASGGQPVNLTGATVKVVADRGTPATAVVLAATADLVDAASGQASFPWDGAALTEGIWNVTAEVTSSPPATDVVTYPGGTITVVPDPG